MSVIWLIERAETPEPRLAAALIGDYAVRAFASLTSFKHLLRLSRSRLPDLLIIDGAAARSSPSVLQMELDERLPKTPIIYVTKVDQAGVAQGSLSAWFHCYAYQAAVDGLHLSAYVEDVLRARVGLDQRSVIRYRGVQLNYQRLECCVEPEGDVFALPRKEAQLLRLLLERPGICLSREEIQDLIWEQVNVTPRTIDSHVSRLRRRLVDAEVEIVSVYGGGYVLR